MLQTENSNGPPSVETREIISAPTHDGVPMIKTNIKYPRFGGLPDEGAQNIINKYYIDLSRDYAMFCRKFLFKAAKQCYQKKSESDRPFVPYTAKMTFRCEQVGDYLSVWYDQTEKGPLDIPCMFRFSDVFLLESGKALKLRELFTKRYPIKRHVTREIRRKCAEAPGCFYKGYERRIRSAFREENFYLSAGGVVFFYQPCTIAGAEFGFPSFVIPYEFFGNTFIPNIKDPHSGV